MPIIIIIIVIFIVIDHQFKLFYFFRNNWVYPIHPKMNKHGAIAIHGTMPHPSQGKSGWSLRFFEVGLGDGPSPCWGLPFFWNCLMCHPMIPFFLSKHAERLLTAILCNFMLGLRKLHCEGGMTTHDLARQI